MSNPCVTSQQEEGQIEFLSGRIKKIYIETGMMKRSEEAERLIKEKGYLQVNLITDRKKDKEILNYSESVHVM